MSQRPLAAFDQLADKRLLATAHRRRDKTAYMRILPRGQQRPLHGTQCTLIVHMVAQRSQVIQIDPATRIKAGQRIEQLCNRQQMAARQQRRLRYPLMPAQCDLYHRGI